MAIAVEVPERKYGMVIGVSGSHPFLFASNFGYGNSGPSSILIVDLLLLECDLLSP